jgi:hypothetical protein
VGRPNANILLLEQKVKEPGGHGGPPLRGGFVNVWQFCNGPMAIQVLKTAQLPVGTDFGNAYTDIRPRT